MSDRFVETTRKGWFSRIGDSVGGALIGLLIFVVAFPLLFWNEGRAVRRAKDLAYGKDAVVSVRPDAIDGANRAKLVHVSGSASATKKPVDPTFGVAPDALALKRTVQMYQWKQSSSSKTKNNVGGSETKTTEYRYEKVWSSSHIPSGNFRKPQGHQNPASMPYESATFVAKQAKLGAFELAPRYLNELDASKPHEASNIKLPAGGVEHGGGVYIGDPSSATVGDVKITFTVAPAGVLTVVGKQIDGGIHPYKDEELNDPIALIQRGKHSADDMFASAQEANWILTWVLRLVGFLLMFFGLRLAARPLSVVGSLIPFIGKIIGFGTGLVAFFVALALSAITVAIAWLFYRPLLAIGLIVLGVGAIVAAVMVVTKANED